MIRPLLCTLLLSVACQAAAGTLYRWTEPDGSLTFSPEPPPSGIAFDTVETGTGQAATVAPNVRAGAAAASAASTTGTISASAPVSSATPASAEPAIKISAVPTSERRPQNRVSVEPTQTLAYAPGASGTLPDGIYPSGARAAASPATAIATTTAPATTDSSVNPANPDRVVISPTKFAQCQELKKRVVSLERRLRSKLSSEDVDNTVVAIVRYQSSFDRHCD